MQVNSRSTHPDANLRTELAFPALSQEQVVRLFSYGSDEFCRSDTSLFLRGERNVDLILILRGAVELSEHGRDGCRRTIAILEDSQFTGELDLLNGRQNLLDCHTVTDCNLLRVSRTEFQHLMRREGDIANLIMQAAIWRRQGMEVDSVGTTLLGAGNSADMIRIQRFLTRNEHPHRYLDIEINLLARVLVKDLGFDESQLPVIILTNDLVLPNPDLALLADALGITEPLDETRIYDVAVIGAGPAGLAAAVYAASEGLSVIVVEPHAPGGQAGTSSRIENYLGFPTGVSGQELANRAQLQAQKFGAHIAISRSVVSMLCSDTLQTLSLDGGQKLSTRAIVVATGARYRKLDVPNYARFEYQGIHYAATTMEADLCRGSGVVVVGGGNSAGQAAVFLAGTAQHVHLLIRGSSLEATMSAYLIGRIAHSGKITLHTGAEITAMHGSDVLREVEWTYISSRIVERHQINNVFVMIGASPNTDCLHGSLELDRKGFIKTGRVHAGLEGDKYATSCRGVFAVGDVRSGSVKRVASAVGEGSAVVSDLHCYLASTRSLLSSMPLDLDVQALVQAGR
jgi:thioredoxin reductase (NADPH)